MLDSNDVQGAAVEPSLPSSSAAASSTAYSSNSSNSGNTMNMVLDKRKDSSEGEQEHGADVGGDVTGEGGSGRKREQASSTARRIMEAITAPTNISAPSTAAISTENSNSAIGIPLTATPGESGGQAAAAAAAAGEIDTEDDGEDSTYWTRAPRAESDQLYELNMQLAAYAKDAQWEQAICLLRQMRARSKAATAAAASSTSAQDSTATPGTTTAAQSVQSETGISAGDINDASPAQLEDKSGPNDPKAAAAVPRQLYPAMGANVEPNVVSYNNVITACANAKKQKRAEGIFREMTKERGLRPNVFSYGALISACAKRGNWEDSVKYLEVRYGVCRWM